MGSLRESNAEVLNAEVVFPFQITAWRDAARDRGIDSVQAKQFRAGILEIISDAIDAARAEGDRRVVALSTVTPCEPMQEMCSSMTLTTLVVVLLVVKTLATSSRLVAADGRYERLCMHESAAAASATLVCSFLGA